MTEPTKEQLNELADAAAATAKLHQDNSVASAVAYALRLAANLPSEEELKTLVFRYTGDHQYPDYSGAAEAILKRIRSVK